MLNWYLQNGKDSDVVISSRVRLARNLDDIPFPTKFSKEQAEEVLEKMKEVTPSLGYGLKFIRLEDPERRCAGDTSLQQTKKKREQLLLTMKKIYV